MCRMSWKSGSLNLLEPSGPHRAYYGTALSLRLPLNEEDAVGFTAPNPYPITSYSSNISDLRLFCLRPPYSY